MVILTAVALLSWAAAPAQLASVETNVTSALFDSESDGAALWRETAPVQVRAHEAVEPQGLTGDTGDVGSQGDAGARGTLGISGLAGEAGPQGPKGDFGDLGPA